MGAIDHLSTGAQQTIREMTKMAAGKCPDDSSYIANVSRAFPAPFNFGVMKKDELPKGLTSIAAAGRCGACPSPATTNEFVEATSQTTVHIPG